MNWFPISLQGLTEYSLPFSLGGPQQGGTKDKTIQETFENSPIEESVYNTFMNGEPDQKSPDRKKTRKMTKQPQKKERKTEKKSTKKKRTRKAVKKLRMRKTKRSS